MVGRSHPEGMWSSYYQRPGALNVPHITLVKKILANGEPCKKCADVQARLDQSGQMEAIDEVLIADERDPESAGMKLAQSLKVDRAPFFVVREHPDEDPIVYTVYFKFAKKVLRNR